MRSALGGSASPLAIAGWGLLLIGIVFKVSLVPAHLWTELDTTPADTLETRLDRFIRRVKAWRP